MHPKFNETEILQEEVGSTPTFYSWMAFMGDYLGLHVWFIFKIHAFYDLTPKEYQQMHTLRVISACNKLAF